jgi:hypothetical protein
MSTKLLPNLLMLGGLVGVVLFALLHVWSVWRHRNHTPASGNAVRVPPWRHQGTSWVLLLAGTLVLVAAVVWLEFTERQGLLSGDGLFAVRARDGWRLDFLFSGESIEAGQVLARLRSSAQEAELHVLHWRRAALEARRQVLSIQPLELDPELARRLQAVAADQRQLRAVAAQLSSEHRLVMRELSVEQLAKQEKHQQLRTEVAALAHEVAQAQAKRRLSAHTVRRLEVMLTRQLTPPAELEEKQTELEVLQAQIAHLQTSLQGKQEEQRLLAHDMARLQELRTAQSRQLGDEMERTLADMGDAAGATHELETQLTQDLKRAALARERELEAVELERRQVEAQTQGLEATLEVRAPFAGQVVYRDPSPNAAAAAATVLVLAPPEGFALHMRLPASEVQALARAGPVTLALVEPAVRRRFRGALVRWTWLPDDPRFVLTELRCQPPAEAIRELASEQKVAARLVWHPPLYAVPIFPFAAGAVVLGGIGLALHRVHRGGEAGDRTRPTEQAGTHGMEAGPAAGHGAMPAAQPTPVIVGRIGADTGRPGHTNHAHTLYDVPSGILPTLTYQLRESVVHHELDAALLTAVEWHLDRHHTRAVAILNAILREDGEFLEHAQHLLPRLAADAEGTDGTSAECYHRLRRILRVVVPELADGASRAREAAVPGGTV